MEAHQKSEAEEMNLNFIDLIFGIIALYIGFGVFIIERINIITLK